MTTPPDHPPDSDAIPFGSSWRKWAARRAHARLVRDLEIGARGKVEGTAMALGATLRAPISGRECVLWIVEDGAGRHVSTSAFFIVDADGERVVVEPERCVIDVAAAEIARDGGYVREGIIAPGDPAHAWGIVTGTADVAFVDSYRTSTSALRRIRSTSIDRAVIGKRR